MSLNLNHLAQFMAIVRASSLAAAAADAGVSAPALSKNLAALERQLGTQLFDRVGRGLQLTADGTLLAEEAEQLLGHADALSSRLSETFQGLRGRLRIGCGPAALQGPVADALAGMLKADVQMNVQIESAAAPALLDRLRRHDIDLVFADAAALSTAGDLAAFDTVALTPQRVQLIARRGHPLADHPALALPDVLDYPWVTPSVPPPMHAALVDMLGAQHAPLDALQRVNLIPDVTLESVDACMRIVAASNAITASLRLAPEELLPSLAPLPIDIGLQSNICIVSMRQRTLPALARRLIEAVIRL